MTKKEVEMYKYVEIIGWEGGLDPPVYLTVYMLCVWNFDIIYFPVRKCQGSDNNTTFRYIRRM